MTRGRRRRPTTLRRRGAGRGIRAVAGAATFAPVAAVIAGVAAVLTIAGGCAGAGPGERSTVIAIDSRALPSTDEARDDIARMERDPRPLPRPVLVLSGWGDPGVVSLQLARELRKVSLDTEVAARQFLTSWTMDDCREAARRTALGLAPGAGAGGGGEGEGGTGENGEDEGDGERAEPFELDVVGKSMGGLIARELARTEAARERPAFRVVRIFTISTPHRGARLAALPTIDPKVVAMRPGSDFLRRLDAALEDDSAPEIVAYARTDDWMVGEHNTAPAGGGVRVVPRPALEFGHLQAGGDPRIVADVMRRLRGERPLLPEPPVVDMVADPGAAPPSPRR